MMSKARSKPSPTKTYDTCRLGILDGHTQKQILDRLRISKPTLKAHLAKKGTNWKQLEGKTKSKYVTLPQNKVRGGNVSADTQLIKNLGSTPNPSNTPHSQTPQSRQGDKPGTPLKLTEEVLETALVKALRDDPIKALNPALAFLDKKKSLSVADDDTEQTEDIKNYYNEVLKNIYQ